MKKKGQITLFLIVALLLLFLLLIALGLREKIEQPQPPVPVLTQVEDLGPVRQYIQLCLQSTAEDALLNLGEHGRIYPNLILTTEERSVNYFYYRGVNLFPPKRELENEVSDYIKEHFESDCIRNFESFPGMTIEKEGTLLVDTTFTDREVHIDLYYPITVRQGTARSMLDTFNEVLPVPISQYYTAVHELLIKKYQDKEWL
ncbi:hypothetical protein COY95_04930, partial [Candidatus Woesearchaeota archaeon CG_4_10_14_0_8_um_filter_47_5]